MNSQVENKTVYYAHSKLTYGGSRELKEISFLGSRFKRIINPSTDLGELGNIQPYLTVVSLCDCLVVSAFTENFVGKGCFDEVKTALCLDKPVFQLLENKLVEIADVVIFDPNDWKVMYGKLITKEKS